MANEQPNIILITTDQQRFDTTGPDGPAFMRTPHLDDLRRQGIHFSKAYSDCPLCVPARVTIMTGRHAFSHGMMTNGPTSKVIGREGTLPALLRELGYQTAAIGKMHFGPERARHGFDEMILPADYYNQMTRSGNPLMPMRHGLGQNELYPTMATVPESMTLTNWIAEQCVQYIRERRDPTAPFFLWCSFTKPHPPLDPPEPYYSMYRNCDIPEPVFGDWSESDRCPEAFVRHRQAWSQDLVPAEVISEARAAYYGLITQIDYNMGRIFAALQDLDQFKETMFIYTSDHGEYLGDHHTGAKTFFHEPSAHVPFVMRLPQSWSDRCCGMVNDSLVCLADVLPTVLTAAGGTPPDGLDGQDLVALARGQAQPRDYIEAMTPVERPNAYAGITDGRWKYIYYPEGPSEQLFDLEEDPSELHDLAGEDAHKDKLAEMRAELIRRHEARGSGLVDNGRLVSRPSEGDGECDRRNNSWPGYHTEHYGVDVRH